jgi:hypothetical protein
VRVLWLLILLMMLAAPGEALAHDDPIVTVRVMCNGFNVLDMDAVLGEISDSATLHVDGTVQGQAQIQAWVKQQMDADLRIEIVDIGKPQKLSDGYTLTWTARLSRQDWRKAGMAARQATNSIVIHNGRITEWTATLDSGGSSASTSSSSASGSAVAGTVTEPSSSMPDVFGIPITLVAAACVALGGASFILRGALRR